MVRWPTGFSRSMRTHRSVTSAEQPSGSPATREHSQTLFSNSDSRRLRWVAGILLTLIFLLYLSSISTYWYPTPDSALYLMLGQSLADEFSFTLWGKAYIEVPPGYPAQIAVLRSVGLSSYFWQNLHMACMALAALLCIWRCLGRWTSPSTALLVLALLACSFNMHHNSIRLLTDVPSMAIFWAGVLLCLRARSGYRLQLILGLLLFVGTCFMRVPGILLAMGAMLGLGWEHQLQTVRESSTKKRVLLGILLLSGGMGLLLGSGLLYSHLTKQPFQAIFVLRPLIHFWQSGEELSFAFLGQSLPLALAWCMFGLPCIIGMSKSWQRQQRLGISILACYLLSFWLIRPTLARYILPVMPLLFWFYLEGMHALLISGYQQVQKLLATKKRLRWVLTPAQTTLVLAIVLLGINLPRTLRSAYRVHHPATRKGAVEQAELAEVADFLRKRAVSSDRFMSNTDQRILAHLSEMDSISISDGLYKGRPLRPADIATWHRRGSNYFVAGFIQSQNHFRRSEEAMWAGHINQNSTELPFIQVFSNHNYTVYTSSPRTHRERMEQEQLQHAAELLKEVAKPTDRLVASRNLKQLAHLSGVKAYSKVTPKSNPFANVEALLDQGATFMVSFREGSAGEHWKKVRKLQRKPELYSCRVTSTFALLSNRIEAARHLEPDPETRLLSAYLEQHRQPGDHLAGNFGMTRLSELSKIPLITHSVLPRNSNSKFELTKELLQQWVDEGANWIVIRLGTGRTKQFWASVRTARRFPNLEEKSFDGYYKVFCTRTIDSPSQIAQEPSPTAVK